MRSRNIGGSKIMEDFTSEDKVPECDVVCIVDVRLVKDFSN